MPIAIRAIGSLRCASVEPPGCRTSNRLDTGEVGPFSSIDGPARVPMEWLVGLSITYTPLPGGWIEDDAPDSGGTSDESITPPRVRRRSRSRSPRSLTYDDDYQPRHRAGGRTVSVSP